MAYYLAERYVAAAARAAVESDALRLREVPVARLLQTVYAPAEEHCFYLFEADSVDVVAHAAAAARIVFEHVQEVEATLEMPA
jgi:hypothetical protein